MKFGIGDFDKICWEILNLVIIGQKFRTLYMET